MTNIYHAFCVFSNSLAQNNEAMENFLFIGGGRRLSLACAFTPTFTFGEPFIPKRKILKLFPMTNWLYCLTVFSFALVPTCKNLYLTPSNSATLGANSPFFNLFKNLLKGEFDGILSYLANQ